MERSTHPIEHSGNIGGHWEKGDLENSVHEPITRQALELAIKNSELKILVREEGRLLAVEDPKGSDNYSFSYWKKADPLGLNEHAQKSFKRWGLDNLFPEPLDKAESAVCELLLAPEPKIQDLGHIDESESDEPEIDIRPGVWHGNPRFRKGIERNLEYDGPHNDEGLLNTH